MNDVDLEAAHDPHAKARRIFALLRWLVITAFQAAIAPYLFGVLFATGLAVAASGLGAGVTEVREILVSAATLDEPSWSRVAAAWDFLVVGLGTLVVAWRVLMAPPVERVANLVTAVIAAKLEPALQPIFKRLDALPSALTTALLICFIAGVFGMCIVSGNGDRSEQFVITAHKGKPPVKAQSAVITLPDGSLRAGDASIEPITKREFLIVFKDARN